MKGWRQRSISKSVLDLPASGFYVYIAWGTDKKRPLYVGKSRNLLARMGQHSQSSAWWKYMQRLAVYAYPTEADALNAEAEAIGELQPEYNLAGVTRRPLQPYKPKPLLIDDHGPRISTDEIPSHQLAIIARVQNRGRTA